MDGGEDLHPKGLALIAHHPPDAAVADDPGGFAGELEALGVGLLLPPVLPHGVPGDGEVPGAGEEQGQSQLRHGVGGGPGGVPHGDSRRLGIGNGDVVHAYPRPHNELQPSALGGVNLGLLDFGGGADDHRVKVPQGGAQGVGLIELLHHLAAVRPKLFYGGGVHSVGDQYAF